MPRGRFISKSISRREKVAKVSIVAKLMFTWLIPHSDREGRYDADIWSIKALFPYVDEIQPKNIPLLLQELADNGLIMYYGNGHKFLQINDFDKHNTHDKDKEAPSAIPTPELVGSSSVVGQEKVSTQGKGKVKDKDIYISIFDSLWLRYPRKLGKVNALKHYKATVKTEDDHRDIDIALTNFTTYLSDKKTEEQYIPYGSTWFNNWRDWVDYEGKTVVDPYVMRRIDA